MHGISRSKTIISKYLRDRTYHVPRAVHAPNVEHWCSIKRCTGDFWRKLAIVWWLERQLQNLKASFEHEFLISQTKIALPLKQVRVQDLQLAIPKIVSPNPQTTPRRYVQFRIRRWSGTVRNIVQASMGSWRSRRGIYNQNSHQRNCPTKRSCNNVQRNRSLMHVAPQHITITLYGTLIERQMHSLKITVSARWGNTGLVYVHAFYSTMVSMNLYLYCLVQIVHLFNLA